VHAPILTHYFSGWGLYPIRFLGRDVRPFFQVVKKYNPTILVVEDDANDSLLITRAFKKIGVTDPVHVVGDGVEAIEYMMGEGKYANRAKFAYPTFILTDLEMPRSDGFAVLEFLKGNPEWAVIPTIVFSGSDDLDDIKKAYMLGASSYHVKPRTPGALVHQLLVLHAYWMTCEVPEVDDTGRQLRTESKGKLGARFPQSGDVSSNGRTSGDSHPSRVKPNRKRIL
jgi:CheY-like chemotaxis protein